MSDERLTNAEIDEIASYFDPEASYLAKRILCALAELRSARVDIRRRTLEEIRELSRQDAFKCIAAGRISFIMDEDRARTASAEGGEVVAQFVLRDGEIVTEAPPSKDSTSAEGVGAGICPKCHGYGILHGAPMGTCCENCHGVGMVPTAPTPPPAPRFTREVLQMFVNHDCSKFYAHDLAAHTERRDLARALLATEDELNRIINKGCDRIDTLEAQLAEAKGEIAKYNTSLTNAERRNGDLVRELAFRKAELVAIRRALDATQEDRDASLAAHRADKGRIDQYAVGRVDQLTAEVAALTERNARLVELLEEQRQQYADKCLELIAAKESR